MRKFVLAALAWCGAAAGADMPATTAGLSGPWELIGAYREHRDGSRSEDYGATPSGTLSIAPDGRYALQIYHAERPPFAGEFRAAEAQEYKRLLLTMSAHFGMVAVEEGRLVFRIAAASNPQWDGSVQRRAYTLKGEVLEWRVPPRPDGDVPISVWRRLR
ncbi:Lipocalin-like domain-containing protein [Duganella sp. CF458]|uniref:lipocalin-like domain-containing protein n=1 Tax=Duganella sp. CF458 TaxID=1884368 RepID=UPI0008E12151|nr:lipocalin-like domain-containing protein [Duganella sp. CF458]SFF74624.1 Lipocalin-like domain-containing protein [Duganella sp. CF458]